MTITIIQNRLYAKYTYSGIEPETKHNVRYAHGHLPPNYPMPATLDIPTNLIAWLWVHVRRTKRNRKMLMQWYLALCFDKYGKYTG